MKQGSLLVCYLAPVKCYFFPSIVPFCGAFAPLRGALSILLLHRAPHSLKRCSQLVLNLLYFIFKWLLFISFSHLSYIPNFNPFCNMIVKHLCFAFLLVYAPEKEKYQDDDLTSSTCPFPAPTPTSNFYIQGLYFLLKTTTITYGLFVFIILPGHLLLSLAATIASLPCNVHFSSPRCAPLQSCIDLDFLRLLAHLFLCHYVNDFKTHRHIVGGD